ncbi:MAG TPA: hypothetical protein PLN21_20075 [Gemmatales bacterium]|nr:hypothetical protein [Gemmatales bacterium]
MRLGKVIWCTVILLVLVIFSSIAYFAFYYFTSGGSGSPEEATRLRAIVENIISPEAGEGIHFEYAAKRFKNGEWVLGIGRDSHAWMSSYRGGGTIVVKDSRGQVRCFFGHVCGPGGHDVYMLKASSLDDFYKRLGEYKTFTEYQWPSK